MKEYWVNVYDQDVRPLYEFSGKASTRERSILLAEINYTYGMEKLLYRIHVKMKEPKPIGRQIPVKLLYGTKHHDWWNRND